MLSRICLFAALSIVVIAASVHAGETNIVPAFERSRIDAYIAAHYRGLDIVAATEDENGTAFDCFVRERQPALRQIDAQGNVSFREIRWPKAAEEKTPGPLSCPAGTVPFKHLERDELEAYGSLDAYLNRNAALPTIFPVEQPSKIPGATAAAMYPPISGAGNAGGTYSTANRGARATIETWNPSLVQPLTTHRSMAYLMVWTAIGTVPEQKIGAGWVKTGNNAGPVFSIFAAASATSSCIQGTGCSQYVQWSSTMAPDAAVTPISTPTSRVSHQYEVVLNGGNWDITFDGGLVGWMQGTYFTGGPLAFGAGNVQVGGYVSPRTMGGPGVFTPTQMGNGVHGNAGPSAAAILGLGYYPQAGGALVTFGTNSLSRFADTSACWSVNNVSISGPRLRYGGPGGTLPFGSCP